MNRAENTWDDLGVDIARVQGFQTTRSLDFASLGFKRRVSYKG
jgi:hypothetical protein